MWSLDVDHTPYPHLTFDAGTGSDGASDISFDSLSDAVNEAKHDGANSSKDNALNSGLSPTPPTNSKPEPKLHEKYYWRDDTVVFEVL